MDYSKIIEIEEILNYNFSNKENLITALTHSSYLNEKQDCINNERLEFLGDAVIELVISNYLYTKFENLSEGKLTKMRSKIVCTESLAQASKEMNISKYILMGKGEINTGGRNRKSILANTFEAILGSIYIDSGLSEASRFVLTKLRNNINKAENGQLIFDYKTRIQEVAQRNPSNKLEYVTIKEEGPQHNKIFFVNLHLNGQKIGSGRGKNKKEAEQEAAYNGLLFFEKKH